MIIFTDAQNETAVVNAQNKSLAVAQLKEVHKTAFCSSVFKTQAHDEITETCELDLLIQTSLFCSESDSVHAVFIAQLAEDCDMLQKRATLKSKQTRIVSHIEACIKVRKLDLSVSNNVISINAQSRDSFAQIFSLREYREQVFVHAHKLFELVDFTDDSHEDALAENHNNFQRVQTVEYAHNAAILLNTEFNKQAVKAAKKSVKKSVKK